jgi:hypothetical protein
MRDRLNGTVAKTWRAHRKPGTGTEIQGPNGIVFGEMKWAGDADFAAHAPEDMATLLDAFDFVLDGRPIRYVVAQLDAVSQELAIAGDHVMAQMLSRLAVMLETLG